MISILGIIIGYKSIADYRSNPNLGPLDIQKHMWIFPRGSAGFTRRKFTKLAQEPDLKENIFTFLLK